jgi:hypothetical protein
MYIYIYIGANSGSKKLWTENQNTATSGKLIKAVYVSYGYVYILCMIIDYVWAKGKKNQCVSAVNSIWIPTGAFKWAEWYKIVQRRNGEDKTHKKNF